MADGMQRTLSISDAKSWLAHALTLAQRRDTHPVVQQPERPHHVVTIGEGFGCRIV